jgi:hypothetical protein
MDLNNERLFLNFLGQYKLAYQNQNFESNFDFIVRDLCTAKTNGLYLSGGALIVSGNIIYNTSQLVTENFSVDSPLTSYPSQYTGFTLSDGTPYVVSNYGYMKDWIDLLTGRTISETSGRAWEVNINNTNGPFYITNANTSFSQTWNAELGFASDRIFFPSNSYGFDAYSTFSYSGLILFTDLPVFDSFNESAALCEA